MFTQYQIPELDNLVIDLPSFSGIFSGGIFSAVGALIFFFMILLVLVWIGLSIYAGFLIVSSFGSEDKIKKGFSYIKSIWIGISYFFIFFGIVSVVTFFVGVGFPWDWAQNLNQCKQGGPAAGRFYFQGKFVNDPNNPQGPTQLSFSDLMREFKESRPDNQQLTAWVACCSDSKEEYIDIFQNRVDVPSNCLVNSTIAVRGDMPANTCREIGQTCAGDHSCCSNNCENSRCVPFVQF